MSIHLKRAEIVENIRLDVANAKIALGTKVAETPVDQKITSLKSKIITLSESYATLEKHTTQLNKTHEGVFGKIRQLVDWFLLGKLVSSAKTTMAQTEEEVTKLLDEQAKLELGQWNTSKTSIGETLRGERRAQFENLANQLTSPRKVVQKPATTLDESMALFVMKARIEKDSKDWPLDEDSKAYLIKRLNEFVIEKGIYKDPLNDPEKIIQDSFDKLENVFAKLPSGKMLFIDQEKVNGKEFVRVLFTGGDVETLKAMIQKDAKDVYTL